MSKKVFRALIALALISCTKTVGKLQSQDNNVLPKPEISYSKQIEPFVRLKCATEGCHVAGFPFGDFTTYTDLKARITNGKVKTLVIDSRIMPPANALPLEVQELEQLKNWIDHDAPDN